MRAEAVVAARERLQWRGEALQALLSQLLSSCFGLLGRLSEVSAGFCCKFVNTINVQHAFSAIKRRIYFLLTG
jgi:hypothetical protein